MNKEHTIKHRKRSIHSSRSSGLIANLLGPFLIVVVMAGCFLSVMMSAEAHSVHSAQGFVQNASIGNQFEIDESQIALQKSQNQNVRQFAQQMIDDHSQAGDTLKATLASMDNAPTPPDGLDGKHQRMLDKLNAASDADFDREYIHDQVKAHHDAVSLFRDYANHGDNPTLKGFASDTLPTLEKHQQEVQQLRSSI